MITTTLVLFLLLFSLPMTEYYQSINVDYLATTGGIDTGFLPPCSAFSFGNEVLDSFFKDTLPEYVKQLSSVWSQIEETRISGLMSMSSGGPIDDCNIGGVWDPALQLAHGGPLPFLSCAKDSRGTPEVWPFARTGGRKWEKSAGVWKSVSAKQHTNSAVNASSEFSFLPGGLGYDAAKLDFNS